MSDLPTMAQTFAILSQEERQREMKPPSHMALESTSLNASVSPQYNVGPKGFNTNYNRGEEIPALGTSQICSVSTANELDTLRIGAISFMVIQPTQKLQEEKGSRSAANVHTSEDDRGQCEETAEQVPLNMSKSQYKQLLNLLGTLQVGSDCSGSMAGALHHMTYTKDALTNLRTLPYPFLITLPNGYKVKVTEIGDGPSLKSPLALGKAKNGWDMYLL
ncbi:hypothetical protein KY290_037339 [Solanum tuberosum]|uniref:Uncharacterized protein n=1 Tax=Solanum tuberosum TaxID=4113 RepID=A0ABQ7TX53_SOLTU|nr:hypothetical protein KY285_036637 [Solanum tuberosum]KAH0738634.1 hypothetical protein KY290_037339 [Solanum tuberosum]